MGAIGKRDGEAEIVFVKKKKKKKRGGGGGGGAETSASRAVEQCSYPSVISAGMYCGKVGSLEFLSSSKDSLLELRNLLC